jgi:hypothetical protein
VPVPVRRRRLNRLKKDTEVAVPVGDHLFLGPAESGRQNGIAASTPHQSAADIENIATYVLLKSPGTGTLPPEHPSHEENTCMGAVSPVRLNDESPSAASMPYWAADDLQGAAETFPESSGRIKDDHCSFPLG